MPEIARLAFAFRNLTSDFLHCVSLCDRKVVFFNMDAVAAFGPRTDQCTHEQAFDNTGKYTNVFDQLSLPKESSLLEVGMEVNRWYALAEDLW